MSPIVATTHVADGLWMSREGTLYLTSPTDSSITRLEGDGVAPVLADERMYGDKAERKGGPSVLQSLGAGIKRRVERSPTGPVASMAAAVADHLGLVGEDVDALRVAATRQVNQGGQWVAAPVQAATVQKLEEIILTRARDLRRGAMAG